MLISEPFLLDSYFKRAVVLLSEHDDKGTLGFILNKPTDVSLNDAVDDFPEFKVPFTLVVQWRPIRCSTSTQ
ncbi:MAG: YqgE/AlgH family protein [Bacteroidetes bacterium]|nr:YqgE/AlgH family protein [Bacteroidota bacterium]